jgi:hypothetical protein
MMSSRPVMAAISAAAAGTPGRVVDKGTYGAACGSDDGDTVVGVTGFGVNVVGLKPAGVTDVGVTLAGPSAAGWLVAA